MFLQVRNVCNVIPAMHICLCVPVLCISVCVLQNELFIATCCVINLS